MKSELIEIKEALSPTFRMKNITPLTEDYIEYLTEVARSHPLKRSRILLHNSQKEKKHTMIIVKIKGCVEVINPLNAKNKKIKVMKGSFVARRIEEEIVYRENETVDFDPQLHYEFEVLSEVLIIQEEITYF